MKTVRFWVMCHKTWDLAGRAEALVHTWEQVNESTGIVTTSTSTCNTYNGRQRVEVISETEDSTEKVKPVDIRLGGCLLLRRPGALTPTGADRPRELVSHLQRALPSPPPSRSRGRYNKLQGSVPLLFPPGETEHQETRATAL